MKFIPVLQDVQNVFFDIDNTITNCVLGYNDVGYFEYALAGLLAGVRKIPFGEALEMALAAEKNHPALDPFCAAKELGMPLELFRNEIDEMQKRFLMVFEDAVALIKTLKKNGHGLFIASNGQRSRAYAALKAAGLAGWEDSEYFSSLFTPDVTGFTKSRVEFYARMIAMGDFNPEEMLVIGDNINEDGVIPRRAGVKYSVIIDRKKLLQAKDTLIVNDLMELVG